MDEFYCTDRDHVFRLCQDILNSAQYEMKKKNNLLFSEVKLSKWASFPSSYIDPHGCSVCTTWPCQTDLLEDLLEAI